jgi:hypothetical protein
VADQTTIDLLSAELAGPAERRPEMADQEKDRQEQDDTEGHRPRKPGLEDDTEGHGKKLGDDEDDTEGHRRT